MSAEKMMNDLIAAMLGGERQAFIARTLETAVLILSPDNPINFTSKSREEKYKLLRGALRQAILDPSSEHGAVGIVMLDALLAHEFDEIKAKEYLEVRLNAMIARSMMQAAKEHFNG